MSRNLKNIGKLLSRTEIHLDILSIPEEPPPHTLNLQGGCTNLHSEGDNDEIVHDVRALQDMVRAEAKSAASPSRTNL